MLVNQLTLHGNKHSQRSKILPLFPQFPLTLSTSSRDAMAGLVDGAVLRCSAKTDSWGKGRARGMG